MARRRKGGGTIATVWILFLIFCPGIFIAIANEEIMGAVISGLFALICGIVIIAHYIINSDYTEKSEYSYVDEKRGQRETEQIVALPNYFEVKISEEFFNETKKSISSLSDFMHYLLMSDFYGWLEKQHLPIAQGADSYQLTRFMILSDIKTAFLAMGSSVDFKSKEGLAILLVTNTLNSNEDVEFGMLNHVTDNTIKPAEDLLNGSYNIFNKEEDATKLIFVDLIQEFNKDAQLQYLIVLYRFLSVTAKADDVVTEQETNYLKHLLTRAQTIDNNVEVEKDIVDTLDVTFEMIHAGMSDEYNIGKYIVRSQKCVISDIQAELKLSRAKVLAALKILERVGVIETEGNKRKVLITREGDVIRLLRGQKALHKNNEEVNNTENPAIFTAKSQANPIEKISTNIKQESANCASKQLSQLIGLSSVKKEIQTLTNFVKIQQEREKQGLKSSSLSYHCVFTGNPGTGKTTVARIVADIYKEFGVLKKGHLVETDRAGLVAEYVGQTAVKTNKIIDSALDGVLFIDEAYSLVGGGESDYGKEAIATLLKRMEDDRDRLVVILAGYTKEMKDFIDTNPGLQSRFNRYIEFPDYTAEELYQIFELNMKKFDYNLADGAKEQLMQCFEYAVANKDKNFGNGRFIRNVFEKTLERQANRLASLPNLTTAQLTEITTADLPKQ